VGQLERHAQQSNPWEAFLWPQYNERVGVNSLPSARSHTFLEYFPACLCIIVTKYWAVCEY
jgi:hypothetical protein